VSDRGRGTIVLLLMLLQVGVPAVLLGVADKPARFGWHMYSYPTPDFTVVATHTDGRTTLHEREEWMLDRREIRLDRAMLQRLCTVLPTAVELADADGTETVRCR
jgi:hypothetical protein